VACLGGSNPNLLESLKQKGMPPSWWVSAVGRGGLWLAAAGVEEALTSQVHSIEEGVALCARLKMLSVFSVVR